MDCEFDVDTLPQMSPVSGGEFHHERMPPGPSSHQEREAREYHLTGGLIDDVHLAGIEAGFQL